MSGSELVDEVVEDSCRGRYGYGYGYGYGYCYGRDSKIEPLMSGIKFVLTCERGTDIQKVIIKRALLTECQVK